MPRKRDLPIIPDDTSQKSVLYRDLASIAGIDNGDLLNCIFDRRLDGDSDNIYVKKVQGYEAVGNDAGNKPCLGLGHYYKSDGTKSRYSVFDGASNSDIYLLSGSTWTAQSRSLTTGETAEFIQFKDDLYVTNGTDAFQKYNGSSWSSLASGTPYSGAGNVAKYAVMYRNMMVSANSANNPQRVWVSDVNDPETVQADNYWDFTENVTGIGVLGTMLVVFSKNNIWVMQGVSPSTMVRTSNPKVSRYGCLSHRSIKEADTVNGKVLMFVSNDTVRAFNGERVFRVGYDHLKNQWPSVNSSYYNLTCAAVYDFKYFLAVPWSSGTTNTKVLVYDLRFDVWTRLDNWQASCFDVYDDDDEILMFGESSDDSRIWYYPSGQTTQKPSASTAIEFLYTTRNVDFGQPYLIKKWKKLYGQFKTLLSPATMKGEKNIDEEGWSGLRFGSSGTTYIDLGADGATWGTDTWGDFKWGANNYVRTPNNRALITGTGKLCKFRFSDSQTSGESEIYNIQPFIIPKKIK